MIDVKGASTADSEVGSTSERVVPGTSVVRFKIIHEECIWNNVAD